MIEIKEYEDKYAKEISKIVIQNMLEVISKDYGLEYCQKSAKDFTVNNTRCFLVIGRNNYE